jgi:hypothetical protein
VLIARYTAAELDALGGGPLVALRPLEGGPLTCFESVTSASPEDESYERLIEVQGAWSEPAPFAVFAEWQVDDREQYGAFEESRRLLFEVRREHLRTFASDWLLRHRDVLGRYLVLGLYGDEEGASTLCRLHPEVQRFAQTHPPAQYAARDVSGLCVCRVERSTI